MVEFIWLLGTWIYTQKICSCDALHVKIWSIYAYMELAQRHRVAHLIVESDSKVIIDMVTWSCNLNKVKPILIWHIHDSIAEIGRLSSRTCGMNAIEVPIS